MHRGLVDCAASGHEGLRRDLTAESTLTFFLGVLATIGIHLDRLEIEQIDEELQGFRHLAILAPVARIVVAGA